jgi:signal transduction histidine kinase
MNHWWHSSDMQYFRLLVCIGSVLKIFQKNADKLKAKRANLHVFHVNFCIKLRIFFEQQSRASVNEKFDIEKLENKVEKLEQDINKLCNKEITFTQIENKCKYIFQKEKLQTISNLLRALCHEMNQPLQAISGYSDLIKLDLMGNNSVQQDIKQIRDQINKAVRINKIANVAKYLN